MKRDIIVRGFLFTVALLVVVFFQIHSNSWAQDSDLEKAEDLLKRISVLYEHGQQDKAEPLIKQFISHIKKADNKSIQLFRQGKYQAAVPVAQGVLKLKEKFSGHGHPDTANSINILALLYDHMGAYQKAEPLYKRTLAICEKNSGPEHPYTAASLNNLGGLYRSMGIYQEAEPLLERALSIYEKASGPEHPDTANSLNSLAVLYVKMGAYQKAEPLLERALSIYEKALGPEHPSTAIILNSLAVLYDNMGAYQKVEPLYKRTLAIYEKTLGPEHPHTATSLNSLALHYVNIGAYQKAEPLYRRALAICEKALGPEHPSTGNSLNSLAVFYDNMGEYQKAVPLLERALSIREKALGPEHPDTAASLNNLALLYDNMGAYQKTEQLYKRALAICEKNSGPEHPYTAASLNNLGGLYRSMGIYQKAKPLLERALSIREKNLGPEHPDTVNSLSSLALLYDQMGAYQKAEPLYKRAVRLKSQSSEPQKESTVFYNLGFLYLSQGRFEETTVQVKRGIELFESARANIGRGERRSSFQSTLDDQYGLLCATYLAMGQPSQALEALERGRAKSFMDLLGTRQVGRSKSKEQTERLALLEDRLTKTREQKSIVIALPKGRKTRSVQLDQQISTLDKKRLEVIEEIQKADPELASLVAVAPPSLSEIQSLLGPDVAVVEYYHMGEHVVAGEKRERLWIFVVHKDGLHFQSVNVTRTELQKALNDYARLLADPNSNQTKLQDLSAKLHGWLVAPLDPVMKIVAPKTLVVVPWGPLFKVPFASLTPSGKNPLVTQYNIVVTPSAGLYRYIVKKRSSERDRLYALGNPKTSMSPLPGAELEAKNIARLFEKQKIFIREKATEGRIKSGYEKLGRPDVVHLACHGIFNESAPQLSYLALTPDQRNDGKLEMHEIFNLDWQGVSLITLSACSSGKGKLGGGQDLVGLMRGFMFAGAPSILASLWDVDDEATRALMVSFYKNYLSGMTKPQALRTAQTAMINSGKWSHPYFWSAFVLYGDWEGPDKAGFVSTPKIPSKTEPPAPVQSTGIKDYDKIIEEREANKNKWHLWQKRMETDLAKVERYDKSNELRAKEKAKAWNGLLVSYNADNPYSLKDNEFRKKARERKRYWTEYKKPGKLFVDTAPPGARVRILNIKPKFYQGMELRPGRYHVETSKKGYETKKMWVNLKGGAGKKVKVRLEQLQASIQPTKSNTHKPSSASNVAAAAALLEKLGRLTEKNSDLKRVVEITSKAIKLDPNNAKAYSYRAHAYGRLKKNEAAIQDYKRAIKSDQNNAEIYKYFGVFYARRGDYSAAIQCFTKAIAINKNSFGAHLFRGKSFSGLKQYSEAIQDFNKAIELKPKHAQPYHERAMAYYSYNKQHAKAIEDCKQSNGN